MKIDLRYPITLLGADGKLIETKMLQFPERLKAKHLKFMPKAFINGGTEVEPEEALRFISGILEIDEEAAAQIDFKDVLEIMKLIPSFLDMLLMDEPSEGLSGA